MVDRVYERNASGSVPEAPVDPSIGYPSNGNPSQGVPATMPGEYWYYMITESLRKVIVDAGLVPDHLDMDLLKKAITATGQFADYSAVRAYSTGDVVRGSDGIFYEFYNRDQTGPITGINPTNVANRPHIWMEWDGVKPGSTIEWRSETLPEGYVENDGAAISRAAYRRVFAVHGTTYGVGDGATTFNVPDDRGEFKRGWDHGRGIDVGRNLASLQFHALERHTHHLPTGQGALSDSGFWGIDDSYWTEYSVLNTGITVNNELAISDEQGSSKLGKNGGNWANETRPRNNAVIYLTKI